MASSTQAEFLQLAISESQRGALQHVTEFETDSSQTSGPHCTDVDALLTLWAEQEENTQIATETAQESCANISMDDSMLDPVRPLWQNAAPKLFIRNKVDGEAGRANPIKRCR